MHIIDKNTVLHDNSNKYQHTGEVVISYKDIKLSLWINTGTQYDNIKFAQLILLSQCYRFQQTENFFSFFFFFFKCKTLSELHFLVLASHPYWLL